MEKEFFDILNEFGEYTDQIVDRDICHEKGLWHKAVALFIISSDSKKVLLQKRSKNKKMWPSLWDLTAGGHVLSGEFGYSAIIREVQEELGILLNKNDITFLGATISENKRETIINRHFNEFYIVEKDIDIKQIEFQKEEVEDIKWFSKEEIMKMIKNNYEKLTDKKDAWNYLFKYFEFKNK